MWSPAAKARFPGGQDDPDLALLAVQSGHAEYWNVKESKIAQVLKMARAAITGKPPTSLGEHREVNLA
ncbi:MAG: pyridoxamine 5'-phosphate oxidase family protein [Ramlibacter sp.]